ncbi:MAG: Gfo/Idh/MocA family oxidoreductase [Clostridia bacterium]|nr:Gfo/Idh/MocA family oxidoreductase [Clostridia bacterium]
MKRLKIGAVGGYRGAHLAKNFMLLNCDVVAFCDFRPDRLEMGKNYLNADVALYDDFDKFLEHDMDAVILGNYFHEHTALAIKCFERGLHVFSECISNGTMAEGVELLRAHEKSNSIYFLAENYPQMVFNLEMQKVCKSGTLGRILYAEGEYNHPSPGGVVSTLKALSYFPEHWRNHLPRTYYVTHSLGPLMRATGATPKRVSAYCVAEPEIRDIPSARCVIDRTAVITTQNDDGSVFNFTGCTTYGAHHNAYRICGTEGQIENVRGMGDKVLLRYNEWSKPEGMDEVNFYDAVYSEEDKKLTSVSGHGGADVITARMFIDCIREGRQPEHPFDIHSAVAMSSVAILGHRSMLNGNIPYDIPDFHNEDERKKYENDRETPFYGTDGSKPTIPNGSDPDYKPTETQMKLYRELVMEEK